MATVDVANGLKLPDQSALVQRRVVYLETLDDSEDEGRQAFGIGVEAGVPAMPTPAVLTVKDDAVPDRVCKVLELQHQELLSRLDEWLQRVSDTIGRTEPEMTLQTSNRSQIRSPASGEPLPKQLPRQLLRSKTLRVKEVGEGEEGLDSYDLARHQGSKVDMFKKLKSEEANLAKSEEQTTQCGMVQTWCLRIVKSTVCEIFFALMIVTNSAYLGVQLEWSSQNRDRTAEQQNVFLVINVVYAVIFLIEVCLRLLASGPRIYFLAPGWSWNWLDVFVVTSTWVELAVGFFSVDGNDGGLSNSNLRLLRVIKVTRLARVLRVLRVVQFVRPLRTLMHCLVDTTKSFVWSLMLLVLMMYVFGLLFTDAAIDHMRIIGTTDPDMDRLFGTVQLSEGDEDEEDFENDPIVPIVGDDPEDVKDYERVVLDTTDQPPGEGKGKAKGKGKGVAVPQGETWPGKGKNLVATRGCDKGGGQAKGQGKPAGWGVASASASAAPWKPESATKNETSAPPAVRSVVPTEWVTAPKLLSKGVLFKSLTEGAEVPGNLLIAKSPEEVREVFDLYSALDSKHPLTILGQFDVQCQLRQQARVTLCRKDRAPRLEKVSLWKLGNIWEAPAVKPTVSADFKKFTPETKVCVRVCAPETYRKAFLPAGDWDSVASVLKELANWRLARTASFTGGQWKWEKVRGAHQLVGHLRVSKETAAAMELQSGSRGVFVTQTQVARNPVIWVPFSEGEGRDDYLRKVATQAKDRKQGVKYRPGGGNDLGMLQLPSDPSNAAPQAVDVQGVPHSWEGDTLTDFLQAQGWTKVQVTGRKKSGRRNAVWTVRALAPLGEPQGPWSYEDIADQELHIFIAKQAGRPDKQTAELEIIGSEDETMGLEGAPDFQDVVGTAVQQGWELCDEGGTGDCGYRSLCAAMAYNADRKRVDTDTARRQGALLRTQAIAHVRNKLDEYEQFLVPDRDVSPEDNSLIQGPTMEAFLQAAAAANTWICGLMLQACSRKRGVPVIVFFWHENRWKRCTFAPGWNKDGIAKTAAGVEPVVLVLRDSHYQWLKPPPQAVVPGGWLMQSAVPPRGRLSGAGKQDSGSAATPSVHSYVPVGKKRGDTTPSVRTCAVTIATPSVHTYRAQDAKAPSLRSLCSEAFAKGRASVSKKSESQARPSSTAAGRTTNQATSKHTKVQGAKRPPVPQFRSLAEVTASELGIEKRSDTSVAASHSRGALAPPGAGRAQTGSDEVPWHCPAEGCGWSTRAPTREALRKKAWNHWGNKHGGPMPEGAGFRAVPQVTDASKALPRAEHAWTCPVPKCGAGLPALHRWAMELSIEKHRNQNHPRWSRKRMHKYRWTDWQQSPYLRQSRAKVAQARRNQADEQDKHKDLKGHTVVRLDLPDISGPRRFLTCSKCRSKARNIGALIAERCPKKPVKNTPKSRNWWREHRDKNLQPLLAVWNITKAEADEYFGLQEAVRTAAADAEQDGVPLWAIGNEQGHAWRWVEVDWSKPAAPWMQRAPTLAFAGTRAKTRHLPGPKSQESTKRIGEASNPGPSGHQAVAQDLRFTSWNAGGAPGLWRLKDESFFHADILCVQETRMLKHESQAFSKACRAAGFAAYWQEGQPTVGGWGEERARGGLLFLVRRHLKHHLLDSLKGDNVQVLVLSLQGYCVLGCYAPPGHEDEAAQLLHEAWARNRLHLAKGWIAVGDWSQPPLSHSKDDGACGHLFASWGGILCSDGKPTRFEGEETLDWFVAGGDCVARLSWKQQIQKHLSDHIPIECGLQVGNVSCAKGRLKSGPKWTKPDGLTAKEWQKALDEAWTESSSQCQALQDLLQLQRAGDVQVQRDWDLYMIGLNDCYRRGITRVLEQSSDDAIRQSCTKLLRQAGTSSGRKGCTAKHQWVNTAKPCTGDFADTEAQRKINRRLARLYEALALARKLVCNGGSMTRQLCDLRSKLWPRHATDTPASPADMTAACRRDIAHAKDQRERLRQQGQQEALRAWKERVRAPSMKGLSRWLTGKDQDQGAVNVYDSHGVAETSDDTCRRIVKHWQTVWKEQCREGQPTPWQVADRLVQDFGPARQAEWTSVTVDDLAKAAKNSSGTAGPDQWSSDELKYLPREAIVIWHALSLEWMNRGQLPAQLRETRMTNLVKPSRVEDNRRLHAKHTRPISIMSTFWRIFASAQCHKARAWIVANLPDEIGAKPQGAGAEELVSELQDQFAIEGGYIASLDFSQCYDHLTATASTEFLRRVGWPPQLCRLMQLAWSHRRWVSWQGHTAEEPMEADVVPQGCPLAPLTLMAWTTAGLRWVEQGVTDGSDSLTRIYMDDRTFWCRTWTGLRERIERWAEWSDRTALLENRAKTQVIGKTAHNKRELQDVCDPSWIKREAKVLGATTVSTGRRADSDLETQRFTKALRRVALLRSTGLSWTSMFRAYQSFVNSIASYGWIGKLPTQTKADMLFRGFTRATGYQQRMANLTLRKVLYGGALDLRIKAGLGGAFCELIAEEDHAGRPVAVDDDPPRPSSISTLFRSISNGMDWGTAADSLAAIDPIWAQLFNFYIAFISFAVLNVMTGVFCNSAIKAAERDHEMVIHSLLQSRKEFKELVSNLFQKIDDLGLGMITISEFERHFNDDSVRAFFESLEMGAVDAWTLFASLDADGDNVISLKDFTERCIQLHGPARSVDLYALTQQNVKLRQQLQAIESWDD
eukprot:s2192_g14.t1